MKRKVRTAPEAPPRLARRGRPSKVRAAQNRTAPYGRAWAAPFLKALADIGTIAKAAEHVRVGVRTVYDLRERNSEFGEAMEAAEALHLASIEAEMVRRGRDGWLEPVFQGGVRVGLVRKFSDTLLLARAKRLDPGYKDRVEHTGAGGGPIVVTFAELARRAVLPPVEVTRVDALPAAAEANAA